MRRWQDSCARNGGLIKLKCKSHTTCDTYSGGSGTEVMYTLRAMSDSASASLPAMKLISLPLTLLMAFFAATRASSQVADSNSPYHCNTLKMSQQACGVQQSPQTADHVQMKRDWTLLREERAKEELGRYYCPRRKAHSPSNP